MKIKLLLGALVLCCVVPQMLADEHKHSHEITAEELGAVSFPISCEAASQKPFEQGVAWLHSFEYEQAKLEFAKISVNDPKCAMAYWGQAMSLFHQLWEHPSADSVRVGTAMLQQAQKLKATPRERDYISALPN